MLFYFILELIPPTFSEFNIQAVTELTENENISFRYSISGPLPINIIWSRSKNGREQQLAWCTVNSGIRCKYFVKTVAITYNSFTIDNVRYPKDNNASFKCQAANSFGSSSKLFVLMVQCKIKKARLQ